ncbi:uncharacterized protein C8A04DRAFT_26180 [Dichotomopilus funicola]|uniref:Uncharacterized protein n=1 Tax=Dichotomopilus funicola TaxID=1934379 RepID=A0AAN6V757_9PEZI|nr:hypothetical protein C8A04DRAFT_26180 [Dichotomopilus funicola]
MHLPTLLTLTATSLLTTTTSANPAPAPRDDRPTLLCPTSSSSHLPGYTFTFLPTLSYTFLLNSPTTVGQICTAGGTLVAHALGQSLTGGDNAPVSWGIEPRDLSEEAGYVAGVLVVRAVGGVLDKLNELVGNRTSGFYVGQEDLWARQVAEQVDEKFEVTLREDI